VRKLTKNLLEEFGYSIIEAKDGEDAILKFMKNKRRVDLVILDVVMPKKNGKEAYEEIKKHVPDVKALFTSGYTADVIHKKGVLDEELDFISKPVSPKELLKRVREIIDRG
jgi:DNA-binding response OmpR family regulator